MIECQLDDVSINILVSFVANIYKWLNHKLKLSLIKSIVWELHVHVGHLIPADSTIPRRRPVIKYWEFWWRHTHHIVYMTFRYAAGFVVLQRWFVFWTIRVRMAARVTRWTPGTRRPVNVRWVTLEPTVRRVSDCYHCVAVRTGVISLRYYLESIRTCTWTFMEPFMV